MVVNGNGRAQANGHRRGRRENTTRANRRIDWNNSEDFDTVLCLALGITGREAMKYAGIKGTVGRAYNRGKKARVSSMDYRTMKKGTIGGDLAHMLLEERRKQLEPVIRRELMDEMPTKRDLRRGAGRVTSRVASTTRYR